MAHLRRSVSDPSCATALALALGGGLCLATPRAALAAPDDDLVLDDEEEEPAEAEEEAEDPLDESEEEEDAPLDDEEAPGASGRASASLGGGADAAGKTKGKKGKKDKKAKGKKAKGEPKKKDDRPFFLRYRPTNHMLNAGFYLGAFIRAGNHGLIDRSLGPQPSTPPSAFDLAFRLEYMALPYVGVGFEAGGMPTRSDSEGVRAGFYTVRGHVVGALPYRLTPTLAVGGGLLGLRSKDAAILNGGDAAFHWGPGLKFYINEWIAVRMDGRHIVTGPGSDGGRAHHGEILFGAEVTLRLTKWAGRKYRAQRADRDEDGTADFYDECPDEYGEDENGCPVDRDGDGDGIKDSRDKCPKEWGDGSDGCPIPDKDGDGIFDDSDSCEDKPETFNGIEDADGCPDELPEEVKKFEGVLEGIYFDTGKSTIRKKSKPVLGTVVELLKKYPQLRVEISGHTDSVGSPEDNTKLSQARADAVKQFLVDAAIEEGRITTRGAGPNEPIADNKTKKGRSKNRRIEFKVL
jgi:outer membrane protein OmpA-like peptidoglycan-associated protein